MNENRDTSDDAEIIQEINVEIQKAMPCSILEFKQLLINETEEQILKLEKKIVPLQGDRTLIRKIANYMSTHSIYPSEPRRSLIQDRYTQIENELIACEPRNVMLRKSQMIRESLTLESELEEKLQRLRQRLRLIGEVIHKFRLKTIFKLQIQIKLLPLECREKINGMIFEDNIMYFLRQYDKFQAEDLKHEFFRANTDIFKFICSSELFNFVFSNECHILFRLKKEFLNLYFKQFFMIKSFEFLDATDNPKVREDTVFVPFEYGLANSYLIGARYLGLFPQACTQDRIFILKSKIDTFLNNLNPEIQIIESKIYYDEIQPLYTYDDRNKIEPDYWNRDMQFFKRVTLICKLEDVEFISPQKLQAHLSHKDTQIPNDSNRVSTNAGDTLFQYNNSTNALEINYKFLSFQNKTYKQIDDYVFSNRKRFESFHFDTYKTGVIIKGSKPIPLIGFRVDIWNYNYVKSYVYIPIHVEIKFEEFLFKSINDCDWGRFIFRRSISRDSVVYKIENLMLKHFYEEWYSKKVQ